MKTIKVKELLNRKLWKKFSQIRELDAWAIEKNIFDLEDEFVITREEAKKLGLIKTRRKR